MAPTTERKAAELRFIKFLVQRGRLAPEVGRDADVVAATASEESVFEWLLATGSINEDDCWRAAADLRRLPFVNLAGVALDASAIESVKDDLAHRYRVVPLRTFDKAIVIATANPFDYEAIRAIEFATGRRVQTEVATPTGIRDALEHAYHLEESLNEYLRGVPDDEEVPVTTLSDDASDTRALLRGSTLPPVVKLFNLILLEGVRCHATDIHVEAGLSAVQVRYRVDGDLEESLKLPKWVQDPLIARCKVMANLDITERRVPQDGRIRLRYREAMIDLRVSSLPTQFGEKLVMRVLDTSAQPLGLDRLDVGPRDLHNIRHAIHRPEGMVLVTGPTGSGKTTTLYGMIAEIVSPTTNIVTIENPIEYQMRGVNQVEINEKQGLTFAATLRSILRQDPDVILVGEIRDRETAEIALRAAQTGHLVLSTLHTNDAAATITRLIDIGIEPYMLASSLNLIVAQRLVRRVCERCAEPYEPDGQALHALQVEAQGQQFRRGRGCPACRKSGYAGRTAVLQVLPITPSVAKLIETKAPESAIRLQARADGAASLYEHAAAKVCAGITTAEEVLRIVEVPDEHARCPGCNRNVEDNFAVCPHCATVLHTNCASCGLKLQKEWQACPYCGAAVKRVASPAPAAALSVPARVAAANNGTRHFRALVVDDQADMRRLIAFTLEHSGLPLSVTAVSGGAEAIEHAQLEAPDLIVLDVMMPEMDGFEVCEQLRANVRTAFIPILMLTALDDPGNRARGFLAGTDDYIGKPFARAELVARVRRLLQRTYGATVGEEMRAGANGKGQRDPVDAMAQLSA
jgi:type II secretory ATPase GspE/PulE/Tfp pilus assembly ATPase PilB-like protein/DNA-binding NarL/FixJ family response regulator